jgi:hypothetical protein
MIEPAAGSVVGPISVVCERGQGGRERIGVADVEQGAAFGGAFDEPTGPEALAGPAGADWQNEFGPVKREGLSAFCGEERRCRG